MQIFIDSADPKQIATAWEWGVIDGVTTNPSLAAKINQPYHKTVSQILDIVDGPVSLEVIATDFDGIMDQAKKLAQLSPNVVVKIPCIPAGIKAAKQLASEGVKTNITLVFGEPQALLAAKVSASYCSPFLGRVDDIAEHAGDQLVANIRQIYDNYGFSTQILAASIRDLTHLTQVALLGADVATVPFSVLQEMFNHKLTDTGLEKFLEDWTAAKLELPFKK